MGLEFVVISSACRNNSFHAINIFLLTNPWYTRLGNLLGKSLSEKCNETKSKENKKTHQT
jgi:hypothetical protein